MVDPLIINRFPRRSTNKPLGFTCPKNLRFASLKMGSPELSEPHFGELQAISLKVNIIQGISLELNAIKGISLELNATKGISSEINAVECFSLRRPFAAFAAFSAKSI
uniref:Uncharacterized protein n=1 Tax=Steinernema glaseri TaxID=37863 RepID=A0A1I8AFK7_9BILA